MLLHPTDKNNTAMKYTKQDLECAQIVIETPNLFNATFTKWANDVIRYFNLKYYSPDDLQCAKIVIETPELFNHEFVRWANSVISWFESLHRVAKNIQNKFKGNLTYSDCIGEAWKRIKGVGANTIQKLNKWFKTFRKSLVRSIWGVYDGVYSSRSGYKGDFQRLKQKPNAGNSNNPKSKAKSLANNLVETFAQGNKYLRASL